MTMPSENIVSFTLSISSKDVHEDATYRKAVYSGAVERGSSDTNNAPIDPYSVLDALRERGVLIVQEADGSVWISADEFWRIEPALTAILAALNTVPIP